MNRYIFLTLIILYISNVTFGQSANVRFNNINLEDGLSHSLVSSMVEDDLGFIWFGTQDGLNRYDGYSFKTYYAGEGNLTPSYSWIKSLFKDSFGQIWIIYNAEGIERFDPEHELFYNYTNASDNPRSISSNYTHYVINYSYCFEDSEQRVWIATESGLNRYNRETDDFDVFIHNPNDFSSLYSNEVTFIHEDANRILWIGTQKGLNYFDLKENKMHRFEELTNKNSLNDEKITQILSLDNGDLLIGTFHNGINYIQDPFIKDSIKISYYITKPLNENFEETVYEIFKTSKNLLLIGTQSGLFQLIPTATGFKEKLIEGTENISIEIIHEDELGYIWVAPEAQIPDHGVYRFNPKLSAYDYFTNDELDQYGFTKQKISFIEETSKGILIIGTEKDGVFTHSLYAKKFMHIDDNPNKFYTLTNKEVYSIYEDDNNNLWVGTKGALNKIELNTGKRKIFERKESFVTGVNYIYSKNVSGTLVGIIKETPDNKLWLGYFDFKVSLLNPKTNEFLNFEHNENDPKSFLNWSMRTICVTSLGKVYFGGSQNGLCSLNKDGKSFSYYPVNSGKNDGPNDSWTNIIIEDRNKDIWIGTMTGGLNYYNVKTGKFAYFTKDKSNPSSIPSNQVKCILDPQIYNDNILWIGTNSGFAKFDKNNNTFKTFSVKDGLPSNVIHGILEDNNGELWLSTNKGLINFDPITENFKVYSVEDGLQGNEFNEGAYFKNSDGILYFGGTNGITYFNPAEITENPFESNVVLTDIKLFNQSISANDTVNGRKLINKTISYTNEIFLKPEEKVISFEFANLDFISPNKIQYKYMLDGFEENWNEVEANQRFATYTNISSGDYILKINGTNSDGKWSETPTELSIHVLPPFWKTTWFKIVVSLSIIVIFLIILSIRTQSLKNQKKKLEKEVSERTKDLLNANQMLEKNQEEIQGQSQKIGIQRDNLREQNQTLENQKMEIGEMAEKLHESDQMKLKFFTNISHEFRTPLTLMLGPTEKLLQKDKFANTKEIKQDLSLIFKNEKRLLKLINQLLEIRKVETGNLKLKVSRDNIVYFIRSLYQLFIPLAEKRNIDFLLKTNCSESLLIFFDQDKIEKIMYNFLSNAFKHTQDGGKITLEISTNNQSKSELLYISVKDNGQGIAEEHLSKVFDRFYQLTNKGDSGNISSGIGLSLAHDLIIAHHGTISVESEVNKGANFTISIPLTDESYKSDEIQDEVTQEYLFKQTKAILDDPEDDFDIDFELHLDNPDVFRILVVEDNIDMQKFLFRELSNNYAVMVANDGEEGISLAQEQLPDLIISDVMMPNKDGFELCKELKGDVLTSHIPIFLLTAKTESENQIAGYEYGADDYILKPFSIDILQHKINNILKLRALIASKFKAGTNYIPDNIKISQIDQGFLQKFVKLVESNIDDTELSGDRIAAELCMSKGNLYKKLKALNGMSVNIYIRTIRLKVAANLLKSGDYTISDVAYAVGFNNPKYFSTCFSEHFSMSPKEYRDQSS